MKKIACSLFFLCLCYGIRAQTAERQVNASGGGSYSGTDGSVSYTIGEPLTATLATSAGTATQGFQQPDASPVSSIDKVVSRSFSVSLFPNPVAETAWLRIESPATKKLVICMRDALGRQLDVSAYTALSGLGQKEISLAGLAGGMYFISISTADGSETQTLRIVKNQ